ncbi:MAG TPA: hypothetical protein VNS34_03640 [Rhizobiaceae bacterium]|nr:hypothetical protein [Rhizobiaceae bacterium]
MPAITRRTLLAFTGAAATLKPAFAEKGTVSSELQALIAAHGVSYAALHQVFRRPGSLLHDREQADRLEQEALLAVCAYSASTPSERRAKAEYLLAVEARGELDREEHMQAILQSMLRS